MNRLAAVPLIMIGFAASSALAQQLSPQEVFKRVAPSVVVVEVKEFPEGKPAKLVASGSGVVVPSREKDVTVIATNCHLVDKSKSGGVLVAQDDSSGLGWVSGRDVARDLCVVHALFVDHYDKKKDEVVYKKLPYVEISSSQQLSVGDLVYAVGAPQGLELSLSDGLVSGFRKSGGTEYIQTTAPISNGSSGGGLFDAQGRLVGITTMFLKEGQALNFAVPAELIASVPRTAAADATSAAQASAEEAANAAVAVAAEEERNKPRDRWLRVGEGVSGGVAFIDTKTIMKAGSDVTAWRKTTYQKPQKDKTGDTYDEELALTVFYCSTRQFSSLNLVQRLQGNVVWSSHDLKSYEVERLSVGPETVSEALLEAACGL